MDIKQLLEELTENVKKPAFANLATQFRTTIRQTQGYTADEKRDFYKQYKHLWDERKAWLENKRVEQEQKIDQLDYQLDAVERVIGSDEFNEQSKLFNQEFRRLGSLNSEKKNKLWERFQHIWQMRRDYLSQHSSEIGTFMNDYEAAILAVDCEFGGAPELKEDSEWDRIGAHLKASRDKLRDIRKQIDENPKLQRGDKGNLYDLIESSRSKIREAEERTFEHHGTKAQKVYDDTVELLKSGNIAEITEGLKVAQSQIRSLWLKRGEKEKYVAMVEELWGRVKEKRKEKKQQFVDWLSKQKDGLDKLRAVKQKAEEALDRIRKNLEENRSRLTDARSGDFADKVQIWVKESEEKEADILKSISDLNHKIDEIEGKLKKHGMM
jgi:hypothetical protein